jgi:hypothetical protein
MITVVSNIKAALPFVIGLGLVIYELLPSAAWAVIGSSMGAL